MSDTNAPFPRLDDEIPWLTTEQMIEVDRAMIEDYGIELIQMMENAGRSLALVAKLRFLQGAPAGRRVTVLAGPGGNGGGALVAARRLAAWGAQVQVFLTAGDRMTPVPAHQLGILRSMGLSVQPADALVPDLDAALILDGMIGYSLNGDPRGSAAAAIEWANSHRAPILALDAPSGVDTTTGQVFNPAIKADATVTLALPKEGLRASGVSAQVGELYLADISVPPGLYGSAALGLEVPPIFAASDVLRLR